MEFVDLRHGGQQQTSVVEASYAAPRQSLVRTSGAAGFDFFGTLHHATYYVRHLRRTEMPPPYGIREAEQCTESKKRFHE
jgi:hypothetical protein